MKKLPRKKLKNHVIGLRASAAEYRALRQLADAYGAAPAQMLRDLLAATADRAALTQQSHAEFLRALVGSWRAIPAPPQPVASEF